MSALAVMSAVFAVLTGAFACAAAMARSLFVMAASIAGASAALAVTLLCLGQGDVALAVGVFGAGLAPVLLLNMIALTSRTAGRPSRSTWLSAGICGCAVLGVLIAVLPLPAVTEGDVTSMDAWIAPFCVVLLMGAALTALGLLGFGERGALGDVRDGEAP